MGGERSDLPCLYSNNSTEPSLEEQEHQKEQLIVVLSELLSPYYKRAAHTLHLNVRRLIELAPSINHIGFLTLTFADNVTDHEEAYRRFRSFNTHYLSKSDKFSHWIAVKERQKRGAWHYHLLVILSDDIRSGVDFDQFEEGKYSTAPKALRLLWDELREKLPNYGLGRSELLPIRTNGEAMARYIGKYISKHIGNREERDKGVRLVNYSKGWIKNSMRFAWNTENSQEWRRKVGLFAQYMGCTELYQLSEKLGSDWAYKYTSEIYNIDQILEENGGLLSRPFESETTRRSSIRKKVREKEKQYYKEQCRFREWEQLQKLRKVRRKTKSSAKEIISECLPEYKITYYESLITFHDLNIRSALREQQIEQEKFEIFEFLRNHPDTKDDFEPIKNPEGIPF